MQATEIYLVRHGQTESNQAGKIQGQSNSPLSPLGIQQSKALAQRLKGIKFSSFISSPLERALETSRHLGNEINMAPEADRNFQEISFGEVEGLTWPEVEILHPELCKQWKYHVLDKSLPGGESRQDLVSRVMPALQKLVKTHPGQKILVVTHGGLLAAIFGEVLGIPSGTRPQCAIDNTSINILRFKNNKWKIKTWGDTAHLENL